MDETVVEEPERTVVSELRTIDAVSGDYIDQEGAYRAVLEKRRKDIPLLDEVIIDAPLDDGIEGKKTFLGEYHQASRRVDGIMPFVPHFVSTGYDRVEELERAIGYGHSDHKASTLLLNPVTGGAAAAFLSLLIKRRDKIMSRRSFMDIGLMSLLGAGCIGGISVMRYDDLSTGGGMRGILTRRFRICTEAMVKCPRPGSLLLS